MIRRMLMETETTVGEFDPSADGAYRNVKTFPLDVKPRKDLCIRLESDIRIDLALSGSDGKCVLFKEGVTEGTFRIRTERKETLMLAAGVFRGDLAKIKVSAWLE